MDQSARYADLSLKEEDLIKGGKHILVAYKMKPKAGHGYLEAAAHFAAESSTGTNVEVSTTDEFTKGVDALVYLIDEATEDMRIAYPLDLFDRNVTDGRMMIVSFLTLAIGNNQGMGDIEHAKMIDIYFPERAIQLIRGAGGLPVLAHPGLNRTDDVIPDVVLLDVHMPDGSGIEAAELITQTVPGVAVVLFSGDASRSRTITPSIASSVSGGCENFASRSWSTVSGGWKRETAGEYDWIAGLLFQDQ